MQRFIKDTVHIKINYLDLFSGIGGFALGIQQAGIGFGTHYFSEIDKYATQIYKRHFPNAIELGDIKNIGGRELGKINLITFGFPCQDLSIAGKRAGLRGVRSGLFFEATRLIREIRSDIFVFENAKGLLSSNDGKDFDVVLREIADIGLYECEWQLVNTSWVLPQNRERIYFVGHLGEGSGQKVFPIRESIENNLQSGEKLPMQPINALRTNYSNAFSDETYVGLDLIHDSYYDTDRLYSTKGIARSIRANAGGKGAKTGLYMVNLHQKRTGEYGDRTKQLDEHSFTLDSGSGSDLCITDNTKIRRLTPTECCRLQGFPDNWCDGVSDAQKYKALGNAVSIPIVRLIMTSLYTQKPPKE